MIRWAYLRGGHGKPSGLRIHQSDQREVLLVVENRCVRDGFELLCSRDMVDVRVGDDDLLDGELVLVQRGEDLRNIGSWIDDDGFARGLIAKDGAVALELPDGKNDM